jgi:BON domain
MTKRARWSAVAVALTGVIVTGSMFLAHRTSAPAKPMHADSMTPQLSDEAITDALRKANVPVANLVVRNVGGIVLVRGLGLTADGERAAAAIRALGFKRVANLVQPVTFDDESLRREAERQLASTRSLDGCTLRVSCNRGVIRLQGTVHSDLQEDVARQTLKNVKGAHQVQVELDRV